MNKQLARWLPASALGLALATSTAFAGFQVQGGKLVEGNGTPFVMRGVSHAHVWYTGTTQQALRDIASTGANTVRFVISDGHHSGSRTNGADLSQLIQWSKENKLIAVLEVHDATGFGDDASAEDPLAVTNYWLSSDVRQAINGQEDYVIINPANEPIGNNKAGDWTGMQKQTVQRLRDGGIKHSLLLDAPNWGQDWSNTMRNNAQQVFDADQDRNTVFAVHMYESYGSASVVQGYYQDFKNKNLPLVVGEFGADHKGAAVDEDAIMAGAQQHGFGYLGWSWSGNNAETKSLDITNSFNVNSLSSWGNRLINGANGIKQTAKRATIYCTTNCGTSSSSAASQGAQNIGLNKPANASDTEGTGYEAAKAFDGNGATRWASALTAGTADLTVDLGGFYNINGIKLSWEAAYAKGYSIQVSSDNVNWSDLSSKTNGAGGVESLSLNGQGRYVRVHMTSKFNTAWGYSLWEVEVYGSPTNPPASSSVPSSVASSTASLSCAGNTSPSCIRSSSSTPVSSSSSSSVITTNPVDCTIRLTNSWQGGGQFDATVKNNGSAVSTWTVYLNFSQAVQGLSVWNANVTPISGSKYKLTNVSWNGNLGAGATTTFGMTANFSGTVTASCSDNDGGPRSSSLPSSKSTSSSLVPGSSSVPKSSSSAPKNSSSQPVISSRSSSSSVSSQGGTPGTFRVDGSGNITKNGAVFPVKCGNWFGLEGQFEPKNAAQNPGGAPMELLMGNQWWANTGRTVQQTMSEIKAKGINMIRLPIAPQTLNPADPQGIGDIQAGGVLKAHSSVRQTNARQALESFIKTAAANNIQVLIDIHSCSNYVGWRKGVLDAKPPYVDATRAGYDFTREDYSCSETGNPSSVKHVHAYNEAKWLANLKEIAGLSKSLGVDNIIGIDIFNEPWGYSWEEWKTLSEHAYQAINSVNPDILVFVEGVSGQTIQGNPVPFGNLPINPNWGENLYGQSINPLDIPKDRLVFSPHTYGPSVFVQKHFMDPAQPGCAGLEGDSAAAAKCRIVIDAAKLSAGWDEHFGSLRAQGYAIVVGEYGGNMDWPRKASSAELAAWSHITTNVDQVWQNTFTDYMKSRKIQACYWAINPESGDTLGWYTTPFDPISNPGGWGTWSAFDTRKTEMLNRLWTQ